MVVERVTKSTKEKSLSSIYLELNRSIQSGDHDRSLKTANRILQVAPHEELAFNCKIVSLIHQSKFNEVIQHINKNESFSRNLHFEKAYCYYRMNHTDKALETIENAPGDDIRLEELRAQIHYRLEHFEETLHLYKEIIKNSNDDYSDERETNLLATVAQLGDANITEKIKFRTDTYELCYNWACILVATEQYAAAEAKLKLCEKICKETMDDDGLAGDDVDVELAIIWIQLAYVYQKIDRIKEARKLYAAALKLKLDDPSLVAVASNNSIVINKDQNLFDSKKKMKACLSEAAMSKLTSIQKKSILFNNIVLSFYTNQLDQCRKLCATLETTYPDVQLKVRVLNAICLARNERHDEALALLATATCKNATETLYKNLAHVQLYMMAGKTAEACDVLENLGENSYRPGIVGALITFYMAMKKTDTALKLFPKTVEYYRKNNSKRWDLSAMWRQAANFQIRNGQAQVAVSSLEELVRSNPNDRKALAQLALSYAHIDKRKTVAMDGKLPGFDSLPSPSELHNLENTNWFIFKKNIVKLESQPGTPRHEAVAAKSQTQRKRRARLPKGCDPHATPDPERWLPKYEKAAYRKKKDRRFKEVIKGSQGSASNQADQFDFSKVSDANSSPVSTDQSPQLKNSKKTTQKKKNKRR